MKKKNKIDQPRSLWSCFLHSIKNVGWISPAFYTGKKLEEFKAHHYKWLKIPILYESFFKAQVDSLNIQNDIKMTSLYDANGKCYGYACCYNDSIEYEGCVTILIKEDIPVSDIIFKLKIILTHLIIEHTKGNIRVIFVPKGVSENKKDKNFEEKYFGYKSDYTFIITKSFYEQLDGVYKGMLIPKHAKIWLIRASDNGYFGTPELRKKVYDLRNYRDNIFKDYNEFSKTLSESIIDPYLGSKYFLYDKCDNRPSTDYYEGNYYGFSSIYYCLPITPIEVNKDNCAIKMLKLIFSKYTNIDKNLIKSKIGFYYMNPLSCTNPDNSYDNNIDKIDGYSAKECSEEIFQLILE